MEENKPITPLEFDIKVREALECEEKKDELTDEEIIKVLEERKSIIDREFERTGTPINFMMIPVDAMVIEDTICLIQRLQDERACLANKVSLYQKMLDEDVKPLKQENQELKEKYVKMLDLNEKVIAEQKVEIERLSFYKTVFDKGLAVSLVNMQETIDKQKAEIERLTDKVENQKAVIKGQNNAIEKEKAENKRLYNDYVRLDDFCADKGCICCVCENKKTCNECKNCGSVKTEKCNNFKIDVSKYTRAIERVEKLQKQVESLTEENKELYKENTTLIAGSILERQDIAKDTAKEILTELDLFFKGTTFRKGYEFKKIDEKLKEIAKCKGVEVE